jgi:GT2 family glycosyltransferase
MQQTNDNPSDRFTVRTIVKQKKEYPPITVIVPFHGNYGGVLKLVENLMYKTSYSNYRVIMVDDASKNKSFSDKFSNINHLSIVRHDVQKGFGAAVNTALKYCRYELFVILHSDCEIVEYSWLKQLVDSYYEIPDRKSLAFISLPSNNPTIKCDDLINNENDRWNQTIEYSGKYMPLYCALGNLSLIKKIGLLREYPYGYFEDQEFYNRIVNNNFKCYVCRKSWILHKGMVSFKELFSSNPSSVQIVKNNYEMLKKDIIKHHK